MFTFGFFVKLFVSGLLSVWISSECMYAFFFEESLWERIAYWLSKILFFVACVCTVSGIFGMIWTF